MAQLSIILKEAILINRESFKSIDNLQARKILIDTTEVVLEKIVKEIENDFLYLEKLSIAKAFIDGNKSERYLGEHNSQTLCNQKALQYYQNNYCVKIK